MTSHIQQRRDSFRRVPATLMLATITLGISPYLWAAEDEPIEEIVVVGSQIKGAKISDALAVSVFDAEDIDILGVDSGEELLQLIPENGQNFFSEAENISGGVNSARGDVGAFNLRNLGTGNTLVLVNGRRLVNAAAFQTEEVGGSFVPVNSVNSNTIPVYGVDRVEVLRDGASAIYGADAVAGVVNTVLKSDFEGFRARIKWSEYEHLPRDDQSFAMEWGQSFNEDRTNLGVFFNYYQRDGVNSQDDSRWADADFRRLIPAGSPWSGSTSFRNTSAHDIHGQFDVVSRAPASLVANDIVDSSGEFEIFPAGSTQCEYDIGYGSCGAEDGAGLSRYNLNENRDLASELDRYNMFMYLNHELGGGMESFTEVSVYKINSNLIRHPSATLSSTRLRVGAENYYNPLGPCGSPNRLPDGVIGADVPCEGLELLIDNYRFTEVPRLVVNKGTTYRVLQGLRGIAGEWDWEAALSWSKSTHKDVTHQRISNTLMDQALRDPTAAAYNPFSGGVGSNIERALVSVFRKSEAELFTYDFKMSRPDLFSLPAGPVGFLAGFEHRGESFEDNRDPRLDGTIQFTTATGATFPYISDVANSSPTADNKGDRNVTSVFAELQLPLLSNLDVQLALRYENFSDVGDTTVGKVAFGWRPVESFLLRGSWSEAFRAPNLITVNEDIVARTNTRTDYVCQYAKDNGGDTNDDLDCRYGIQRTAQGSKGLQPEESNNYSVGLVFEPIDDLTLTLDYWRIEKTATIGLFGENNHSLLDLVMRLEAGTGANCETATFNPAVVRVDPNPDEAVFYTTAGICAAGETTRVDDQYANLDDRTLAGHDIGIYYQRDTRLGLFSIRYNGSFLDTYDQEAGGAVAGLLSAQQDGALPAEYPVSGFADLIGQNGNQDEKHSLRAAWRHDGYGVSVTAYRLGSFYQSSLTLGDGTRYVIPSFTTYDATFDYRTTLASTSIRFRLGIKNLTDERAPLADRFFGFFADAHQDYGRNFYLEVRTGI